MRARTRPTGAARLALAGAALLLVGACAAPADDRASDAGPSSPAAVPSPEAAGPTASPEPEAAALPDVPVARATVPPAPAQDAGPQELAIPAVGVVVPVDPVGVAPDGQMEIPPHAERAGWYRFGAAPGDGAGTAVVAAHVDSIVSEGLGPFARLGDLSAGDEVVVTAADGTVLAYEVTDVVSVPKTEIPWEDVFVRDGGPRLVLVTCGGSWRAEARSYSDNVIVTAVPRG